MGDRITKGAIVIVWPDGAWRLDIAHGPGHSLRGKQDGWARGAAHARMIAEERFGVDPADVRVLVWETPAGEVGRG